MKRRRLLSIGLAVFLALPLPSMADEIEPSYEAGYRMGFFMAVAAANYNKTVCGNIHFVSLTPAIASYFEENGEKTAVIYDKVLAHLSRQFPCKKAGDQDKYKP
jgi:hypothetical protein